MPTRVENVPKTMWNKWSLGEKEKAKSDFPLCSKKSSQSWYHPMKNIRSNKSDIFNNQNVHKVPVHDMNRDFRIHLYTQEGWNLLTENIKLFNSIEASWMGMSDVPQNTASMTDIREISSLVEDKEPLAPRWMAKLKYKFHHELLIANERRAKQMKPIRRQR